jgi:hypothetical protein
MKKHIKLLILSIGISLIFIQNACQKPEIVEEINNMSVEKKLETEFLNFPKSKGSLIRNKVAEAIQEGNYHLEKPFKLNPESLINNANARESAAADKGCGKFKKVTTSYPGFFDEFAVVYYTGNNLIDYIDFSYSDDPSANGRMIFNYLELGNGKTRMKIYWKKTSGEFLDNVDVVELNEKGYATNWLKDLTNFEYDEPYTKLITYNSAGQPIVFEKIYQSKTVSKETVKYTKENNFDTTIDSVTGNVFNYTYDLTKPAKIDVNSSDWITDFTYFFGINNTNHMTKYEVKDKTNKVTFTVDLKREFTAEGYPSKVTRTENGEVEAIFKDITYDCRNYNFSQPRTYK